MRVQKLDACRIGSVYAIQLSGALRLPGNPIHSLPSHVLLGACCQTVGTANYMS